MKKLFFVLLATAFLFSCAGLQLTETQDFTVKKLSRIAGITLALEKPGEVDKALSYIEYMEGLDDGNLKDAALNVAIEYIYKTYGKTSKVVILVAETVDLVRVLIPETGQSEIDMRLFDIAVAGFKEGLILASQ